MTNLHYLLWAYFITYPVYIYLTHDKEKQSVLNSPQKRIKIYQTTILHLWLPTLVLLALVGSGDIAPTDIGIVFTWDVANQIGIAAIALFIAYAIFAVKQFIGNAKAQGEFIKQVAFIRWFMPHNKKEAKYFTLGVSLSAGICEELLFRGYLLHALGQYMPSYGAVIVSSLVFGAMHIYQGKVHVLRTAFVGVTLSLIYLATDSIVVPILIHALGDIYSGILAYVVFCADNKLNSQTGLNRVETN